MVPGKVSVVVVNWNGRRWLERCLPALLGQTYPHYEVVLVDNGSSDGSADWVARAFPRVRLLRHPTNLGFAAANNLGIAASDGEYVATLNNDAFAEPEWLSELVKALGSHPRVGMAASLMIRAEWHQFGAGLPEGGPLSPREKVAVEIVDSAGLGVDRAGLAWDRLGGTPVRDEPVSEVFGPCAGAALYRRRLLEEVGPFDPAYFAYLEDVDLAWRARLQGWRALYVPSARVHHLHSGTWSEGSARKRYYLGRNKWWTIAKNYPWPDLLRYLPALVAYDALAVLGALFLPSPDGLSGRLAPLAGRLAALRGLPAMLQQRRQIQAEARRRRVEALGLSQLEGPRAVRQRYAHLWRAVEASGYRHAGKDEESRDMAKSESNPGTTRPAPPLSEPNRQPAISVVIPAYNAASTLGKCLEALRSQSVAPGTYEVIVVDDGSTDDTAALATAGGARVVRGRHAGPAAARNLGALAAAGSVLLFVDADCAPTPHWIEKMVAPLQDPEIVGVKGIYRTAQGGLLPRFVQAEFEDRYVKMVPARYIDFVDTYAAAYRRSVFLESGGFDASFPAHSAEDVELSFRLARLGFKMVFAPEAAVYHRHPESLLTYLWKKFRYGIWRVRVYHRYPGKLVRDSYTPRWMPVQIGLAGLTWLSLLLSLFLPPLRPAPLALAVAFAATTVPFALRARKQGRLVGLISPGLLFLRSTAQGAGLCLGIIALLYDRNADRRVQERVV